MLTKDQIEKWSEIYDVKKYSICVYDDLVIKKLPHNRRFSIMGAWKTGCLKIDPKGTAYKDSQGQTYSFTDRWNEKAPVGFKTWYYLDREVLNISAVLPSIFPEQMPEVLFDLLKRPGFGFVFSIFVAHVCLPNVYPLYDQHVYRAYKSFDSTIYKLPMIAAPDWNEYHQYQKFFVKQCTTTMVSPSIIDRALWKYGKNLKKKKEKHEQMPIRGKKMIDNFKNWNEYSTLSKQIREGKQVSQKFFWRVKGDGGIIIIAKKSTKEFSGDDYQAMIEHINSYKSGIPLGARRDGTLPTDSLGALMEKRWETSSIRGWCSHLAAVAVTRGHIEYEDKGRGPGKGIWLYPKKSENSNRTKSRLQTEKI